MGENQERICPHCGGNNWTERPIHEVINPNGEYVEGYGCVLVSVQTGVEYRCDKCYYRSGDPVVRLSIPSKEEKEEGNEV